MSDRAPSPSSARRSQLVDNIRESLNARLPEGERLAVGSDRAAASPPSPALAPDPCQAVGPRTDVQCCYDAEPAHTDHLAVGPVENERWSTVPPAPSPALDDEIVSLNSWEPPERSPATAATLATRIEAWAAQVGTREEFMLTKAFWSEVVTALRSTASALAAAERRQREALHVVEQFERGALGQNKAFGDLRSLARAALAPGHPSEEN